MAPVPESHVYWKMGTAVTPPGNMVGYSAFISVNCADVGLFNTFVTKGTRTAGVDVAATGSTPATLGTTDRYNTPSLNSW